MSITIHDWAPAIGVLCAAVHTLKTPSDDDIANSWRLLHPAAKIGFTPQSLDFAVRQRLLDLEAPRDLALHVALLRYVFPVCRIVRYERGRGVNQDEAIMTRGPRPDLAERMAEPDRFHDPGPPRPEVSSVRRLPEAQPEPWTAQRRAAHLARIAVSLEALQVRGHVVAPVYRRCEEGYLRLDPEPQVQTLSDAELAQGRAWFERCLRGRFPLEFCAVSQGWALRNTERATELLQQAQAAVALEAAPWQ
jgi:hypothetical protein